MQAGVRGATIDTLLPCLQQLAASEAALSNRPDIQLAGAERELLITRMLEAVREARFEKVQCPLQDLLQSRFNRLGAEVRLLELRRQFPGVAAAPPPAVASKPSGMQKPGPYAAERADVEKVFRQDLSLNPAQTGPLASIEPEPGDDERRQLLKALHKTAASEMVSRFKRFAVGAREESTPALLDAIDRFRTSGMALRDDPASAVAAEERAVALYRAIEYVTKVRGDAGRVNVVDGSDGHAQAVAAGLGAQLRLIDAKRRAAAAPAKPPDKPVTIPPAMK
jgi:hypothetical protein